MDMHKIEDRKRFRHHKAVLIGILSAFNVISDSASADPQEPNSFGLLIIAPSLSIDQKISIAHELRVSHIRSIASSTTMKKNNNLLQYKKAGFDILLNVIDSERAEVPSKGVTDIARYKRNLATILDAYNPDLLVVENEENNL